MKILLLFKLTVLTLLLLPQQVPGAATQSLPNTALQVGSTDVVLRKLDFELRVLSQALPQIHSVSAQQLQQIEDLWQQLFALSQSPLLNKLYNQYQVQLQQALQSSEGAVGEVDARQMIALRQRLMAALTLEQQQQ
ncbi:hypothetical protein [Rheinheimera texasensis]|uniref:hypothetical protein n=1 Tax=Rheinheimera texasensis TaxID=306205 RepID=UPI0004E1A4A7|nr:hypothetical protein [Rheinheimera texasensis]